MSGFFRYLAIFFLFGWISLFSKIKDDNFYDFVVFFVVDQLRSESIPTNFRKQGFFFKNLILPYSCTETAPGHATLLSGRTPKEHGIIGNSWYEEKNRQIAALDLSQEKVGKAKIPFSPWQFHGDHLSIFWKRKFTKSYFISISHKERSAVFLGGPKADLALAVNEEGVGSSTYYPLADPIFLDEINRNLKNFPAKSLDEKILRVAEWLIFDLSKKRGPHFLAISLSELDILAHQIGYENLTVKEHIHFIFKKIDEFEKKLHTSFPKKKFLFFLTSDHGSTTIETEAQKFQKEAIRITPHELYQNLWEKFPNLKDNAILQAPHIYLKSPNWDELPKEILNNPYVYLVYLPREKKYFSKNIPNHWQSFLSPAQEIQDLMDNCFFEPRSPSLYVVLYPFIFLQDEKRQIFAGHGSPHRTDRKIPLWIWGDGFPKKEEIQEESSALYLAKTVALLNKMEYPHPAQEIYLLPKSFLLRFKRN